MSHDESPHDGSTEPPADTDDDPIEVSPTTRPATVLLVLSLVVLFAVAGLASQAVSGGALDVVLAIVGLLLLLTVVRYGIRIYVLTRTTYRLTDEYVGREFSMLYQHRSRELPLNQLRGIEMNRGRVQTLLGYGDLTFLTAGPNRSLGFVQFESIPEPEEWRERVRTALVED